MQTKEKHGYLIANFGGPRNLSEVNPFLKELLTDQDVVRTSWPAWLHQLFFSLIAKRRTPKVSGEYEEMGGKSPIYEDTMAVSEALKKKLPGPLWTFHRYLPDTHSEFIETFTEEAKRYDKIFVVAHFPQFTYATTGSVARWMSDYLPRELVNKLRWVKSFPTHSGFIGAYKKVLDDHIQELGLCHKDLAILCSFHGIPQKFVDLGDPYSEECTLSFHELMKHYPDCIGQMAFQSRFGKEEWIKPYTEDVCKDLPRWVGDRKHVVVVPLAFTSDHIETLCEIEDDYIPLIKENGVAASRCSALNREELWVEALYDIVMKGPYVTNQMLMSSFCPCPALCPKIGQCACPR